MKVKLTKMKNVLITYLILFFYLPAFAQNSNITGFYEGPFEDVLKESKRLNKPIFLDFTANWCKSCAKMEKETFANPIIANQLNSDFIAYKVNLDETEGKSIAKKYNITDFPSFLFLSNNTIKIGLIKGFYFANQFKKEMEKIMNQQSTSRPSKKRKRLFG